MSSYMTHLTTPDVMLLAAGLGTRMRPITETVPKPLVTVAGVPLIDRVAAVACAEGSRRFAVNIHHLADKLRAHLSGLEARLEGAHFAISDETDGLLDTGGGVRRALPLLESDPLLVMNTDAFWRPEEDAPIARLQARFHEDQADIVLLCAHPMRALGFRRSHDFCLDPAGRVTLDSGLPVIYAGTALLRRSVFEKAPEGPFSLNLLFEAALEQGTLRGVLLNATWFHVGDPEAIAEAEAALGKSAVPAS